MKQPGRKQPEQPKAFRFLGFRDGWYALHHDSDYETENQVGEWLIEQRITIGQWAWMGNGTVYPNRPQLPVPKDGSLFAVLLKRPADVLRFEIRFPCLGITPQAMLDALRSEATKTRLTVEDITRIVYDALRLLDLTTGNGPNQEDWDTLSAERQAKFVKHVRLQIENPQDHREDSMTTLEKVRTILFASTVFTLIPLLE